MYVTMLVAWMKVLIVSCTYLKNNAISDREPMQCFKKWYLQHTKDRPKNILFLRWNIMDALELRQILILYNFLMGK